MRALVLEVFYDGAAEPSISVPALDFFGLPHGRPAPYVSALLSAQEGRGFNAYLPIPFRRRIRIELTNASPRPTIALLPARLHARAQTRARDGPPPRLVPAREPDA